MGCSVRSSKRCRDIQTKKKHVQLQYLIRVCCDFCTMQSVRMMYVLRDPHLFGPAGLTYHAWTPLPF